MTRADIEALPVAAPPPVTHRLVPSRFPPVQTFESVASAADLAAVLELEGWTNDRLVEVRLRRLGESDWVYGRTNASVVMAAFLHGSPQGLRFTGPDLGAWYAASAIETAVLEVANGLRREVAASALEVLAQDYREYVARLVGGFVDLRGGHPDLCDPDPASYPASQDFGERVRGSTRDGIAYESVRHPGGENWVAYRPRKILDVAQGRHLRLTVRLAGKVIVERLDG